MGGHTGISRRKTCVSISYGLHQWFALRLPVNNSVPLSMGRHYIAKFITTSIHKLLSMVHPIPDTHIQSAAYPVQTDIQITWTRISYWQVIRLRTPKMHELLLKHGVCSKVSHWLTGIPAGKDRGISQIPGKHRRCTHRITVTVNQLIVNIKITVQPQLINGTHHTLFGEIFNNT